MKLGIMQPYFFPYLGYFSLINYADEFILFDTAQFIRHGWIERNQMLKHESEALYIKVALNKHHRETKINEITINNNILWKNKIIAQLAIYKKKAPNYHVVINILNELFENDYESITELNFVALKKVCEYLNVKTPIHIWSEMDINIEQVKAPDEWALCISKAYKASTYINPIGGQLFFDRQKYIDAGIEIQFMDSQLKQYSQLSKNFVSGLSILDVMMFNSVEEIQYMLRQFDLK